MSAIISATFGERNSASDLGEDRAARRVLGSAKATRGSRTFRTELESVMATLDMARRRAPAKVVRGADIPRLALVICVTPLPVLGYEVHLIVRIEALR